MKRRPRGSGHMGTGSPPCKLPCVSTRLEAAAASTTTRPIPSFPSLPPYICFLPSPWSCTTSHLLPYPPCTPFSPSPLRQFSSAATVVHECAVDPFACTAGRSCSPSYCESGGGRVLVPTFRCISCSSIVISTSRASQHKIETEIIVKLV